MLTDDDLTRDLRAAFHDTTTDLRYDGPVPAGPHTPVWARAGWVALPAAAAVAATVVVVGGQQTDVTAPPAAAPSTGAPALPGSSASPSGDALVTDTIEVAGYTMTYRRPADAAPPEEHLFSPDAVPDGAREVTFAEMSPARAWVGTDPATGDPTLYLDAPTRNDGHLMGLSIPGFDEAALIDLLKNGSRD